MRPALAGDGRRDTGASIGRARCHHSRAAAPSPSSWPASIAACGGSRAERIGRAGRAARGHLHLAAVPAAGHADPARRVGDRCRQPALLQRPPRGQRPDRAPPVPRSEGGRAGRGLHAPRRSRGSAPPRATSPPGSSPDPGCPSAPPGMASVGGLRGVALDVALQPSWTEACPFANGVPSVPLFNSPEIDHWVVVGNERLRVHLLDLPGGGAGRGRPRCLRRRAVRGPGRARPLASSAASSSLLPRPPRPHRSARGASAAP